jgi:hypothetical protein
MSLLPLLLVLTTTASPGAGVLAYEGPAEAADPSAYKFTKYEQGDKPFLAVDEANLRGSASIDAPVVRTLRLGSQVEVLEVVSEALFVKDRVDRWYRVRTRDAEPKEGFVLGNVLTPLAATSDLDGDGKEESLAVSFTSDFVVRVRVLEPELATKHKRAVAALDFLMPEAAAGKRGGRAGLVEASVADQGAKPSARAFGLKLCGVTCVVHAVTYEAKKGVLGSLSVPPDVRAGLRLHARPRKLFSLRLESESRGPNEDVPCSVIAQVRGGPLDLKDVLSCVLYWQGKSAPDELSAIYYVMEGSKQLRRLGKENDYEDQRLDQQLKRKGYRVVVDPGTIIPGLTPPKVLYADARGQIRRLRRTTEDYERSAAEVAFVHPILGTVTMTRPGVDDLKEAHPLASNGFFVPEPAGGFLFYAYQRGFSDEEVSWKEARLQGVGYTLEHHSGCEVEKTVDPVPPDVRAADLEEVGEVDGAGPLFALKNNTHPEVERAWEEWNSIAPQREGEPPRYASQEDFFASTPRLYWRDSFGRLLRLRRADLKPPCMAEPIVYFYPEQRSRVRYTLSPVVRVARAVPLAKGNAWTFIATPQGILEEVQAAAPGRARRTFAHLFWEGTSMRFSPPAEGVCVPSARSSEFFREVLPRLGLLAHETEDFVAAWAPRMQGAAFHVIGFHPREVLDTLAPVEVSPTPRSMIRLLMDATPVEACPAELTPPPLPDLPPAREGFTVVEWGGVLREGH